jgi:hypothetical protein
MAVTVQNVIIKTIFLGLLLLVAACATPIPEQPPRVIVQQVEPPKYPTIYEYDLPKSITFCGEVMDLTNPEILEMFDREFTITVWDRKQVFMWIKRANRYFPYFEKKLAEHGLPDDLKYLAVAESALHPKIKSSAGALGLWQMVSDTARRYGLYIEPGVMDERLSYERSTEAALNYLSDLNKKFNDWFLSMAAYNCGEYQLNSSMKKQGAKSYFQLTLPRETERYIYRIAVIKLILENPKKFGYSPDPGRYFKPFEATRVMVDVDDKFYITDLSELSGFTYKEFVELNPKILSHYLPRGSYSVNVPKGYADKFITAIENLKDPDFKKKNNFGPRYYTVKKGDVLSSIAWQTGVSMRTIKQLNHLGSNSVKPGQRLIVRD